jgi:hemoglobin
MPTMEKVLPHHFALYVNHLLNTLRDCGMSDQDVNDIIGRINTSADDITGDTGHTG